ncbi:MAG TPA: gluconokinase [Candidatus Avisuccinivibrio pullicola]|nr:gluconokinase [Candidatus Avisuccinivibrio pullicola]
MSKKNIVIMGVCGSGKTSVGLAIAEKLGCRFLDGDDLHPRANIIKMGEGHPLNDEDRQPWLERISDVFFSLSRRSENAVIVCSALKKKYRDVLRNGNDLIFVHLVGDYDTILNRMKKRQGHYMKENMVKSQFDTLEMPGADEKDVIAIDITPPLDVVIARAVSAVEAAMRD